MTARAASFGQYCETPPSATDLMRGRPPMSARSLLLAPKRTEDPAANKTAPIFAIIALRARSLNDLGKNRDGNLARLFCANRQPYRCANAGEILFAHALCAKPVQPPRMRLFRAQGPNIETACSQRLAQGLVVERGSVGQGDDGSPRIDL
jgi:hypothetical protein